jgi:D-alanyl-D-alanine carboxypeptidase (penicillin-binding protein 5/6)
MRNKLLQISAAIIVIVAAVGIFLYLRPIPVAQPIIQLPSIAKTSAITLPWPDYGQSALGAVGYGVLAENGDQKAVPIASITKVVTALAVLKQKPLDVGQQGPIITLDDADVAIFNNYYSQGGSVVKVVAGEQISEYQALQAMLLPSANNMADSLVRWAFGSSENYVTYANNMLSQLGLGQIHVADASGFSPESVGSPHNLVLLGETALSSPVLAQIVSQSQASIPVAGMVTNTNWQLGKNGIIGIKTGNTDQAGGCYLFAANQMIGGQNVTFVGSILGAPNLQSAVSDSSSILAAANRGFQSVVFVHAGQKIGYYKTPWGASSPIVASKDLSLLVWGGTDANLKSNLNSIKLSAGKGENVGTVSIASGEKTQEVTAMLKQALPGPSWHWRIFRF